MFLSDSSKSVRPAGPYVSCMKINGIPILPPILDPETRREMRYYKALAQEVEKRVSLLKPLDIYGKSSGSEYLNEDFDVGLGDEKSKLDDLENFDGDNTFVTTEKALVDISLPLTTDNTQPNMRDKIIEKEKNKVLKSNRKIINNKKCKTPNKLVDIEIPERDYNCSPRSLKYVKLAKNQAEIEFEDTSLYFSDSKGMGKELFQEGHSSLSSKSFTGSLNNIHYEVSKDSQTDRQLIRQSSYTLLQPSPQLLAHLTAQSISTGLDMTAISMTDSKTNLNVPGSPTRKRRSWDLETAKEKWSSMAQELEQKALPRTPKRQIKSPYKASSKTKVQNRNKPTTKTNTKSDQPQKSEKNKENVFDSLSTHTVVLDSGVKNQKTSLLSPNKDAQKSKPTSKSSTPKSQISTNIEDPALKVRELYEKVQKQQLQQMAALVEKQKREQMLLQQVFEEQNNLLYRQLKNICPTSPLEIKQAWNDKSDSSTDRGPVSLSELIKDRSPPTINSTLADTSNYISHCDQVLKKSKNISSALKNSSNLNKVKGESMTFRRVTPPKLEGSRTRTHSPVDTKKTQRKLDYDANSDKDLEALTDRTNDTLADLNESFPTDESVSGVVYENNNTVINIKEMSKMEFTLKQSPRLNADDAIRSMMEILGNSLMDNKSNRRTRLENRKPTDKELAASSKIVAYVKGYLVRRLMRTERVQTTVQTIKDALLCALELHQDREGIRGADVDLHRRLIQQITAACYNLHETFIMTTPQERCALISADRARQRALATRQTPPPRSRNSDLLSHSFSGSFPARAKRSPIPVTMTRSNYETYSSPKSPPSRRPWR